MEKSELVGNCCEELRKKMGLGKKFGSGEELGLGSGCIQYTRSRSGKRIAISSNMEIDLPTKKRKQQSSEKMSLNFEMSPLESLPQEILVKIVCGVDHGDLKQLFHVSKSFREASLIAKQWHFEYSTPKKTSAFRNSIDLEDAAGAFEEVEAPNAPKQLRFSSRVAGKKLAGMSVALFASPDEDDWPRKDLFMEI